MRKYGLIGFPLEHSFSAAYFHNKFKLESITDAIYKNYPLENIEELTSLINNEIELCGLNVTIPYKKKVFKFLDSIDQQAKNAGSVNVIKIIRFDRKTILKGYNSDIYGFRQSLLPYLDNNVKQALILGTGGSSGAVAYVLDSLNINKIFVSRTPGDNRITYRDITDALIKNTRLIVNTTPIGMYPETDAKPEIPYDLLTKSHILYDLIYNPEKTLFLKEGEKRGCMIINGLSMLKLQAEKSWEIWNDPLY